MKCKHLGYWIVVLLSHNVIVAQQPKLMLPIGHSEHIYSAVHSPDGKFIITASNDRTAKLLDASDGKLLGELKHTQPVKFACLHPMEKEC